VYSDERLKKIEEEVIGMKIDEWLDSGDVA